MQGRLKIGIIGHLGSIGSRHYKNFRELGCDVFGYDPANEIGSLNDLSNCDAVVICSPTEFHLPWIRVFSSKGWRKPMLIEKPIIHNPTPGLETDLVRMVGYNLRFHSCVKKVRNWLGLGLIGRPIWARFTCAQFNEKPAYLRDGVLLNWSHEIDLALYLLGTATCKAAAGYGGSTVKEDMVDLILRHDNNYCQTVIHLDYLTKPERRGFVIVGTNGSIDADMVSRQAFCKDADGRILHNHFGRDSFDGNYISEAAAFLALVKGMPNEAEVIGCTAEEALRVVDVCFQAKELIRGI